MIVKRAKIVESPFLRADLSRQIISQNKQKLLVAPVFLKDGLLTEIRDRKKRRRVSLRRWVSWTSAVGFGAFVLVVSLRQSGLEVPLNISVALEVPVPKVNDQKVVAASLLLSDGVVFPSLSPGSQLGNKAQVTIAEGKTNLTIPVLPLMSGHHFVSVDFFRADGVLVASRILDLKTTSGGRAPRSEPIAKVKSSLHAFALLLRPTLFTTKVIALSDDANREFRSAVTNR